LLQLAEIFYSLQGEGTCRDTRVFVVSRLHLSCAFCDTDYALKFLASVDEVVAAVRTAGGGCRTVILTGGEPLAQRETPRSSRRCAADGRRVHIESNGTLGRCPRTCG